jgi:hypothetical protein
LKQCHANVAASISVGSFEGHMAELVSELWGLTKEDVKEIRNSSREMM